jgi:hypothetical protein
LCGAKKRYVNFVTHGSYSAFSAVRDGAEAVRGAMMAPRRRVIERP